MSFLWLFLTLFSHAQVPTGSDSAGPLITDPGLSTRCRELLRERNEKITVRQRLADLHRRNQNLLKKIPKQRQNMRNRLTSNGITVRNELYLTTMQVQNLEEGIIRSGCPGISL